MPWKPIGFTHYKSEQGLKLLNNLNNVFYEDSEGKVDLSTQYKFVSDKTMADIIEVILNINFK